MSRQTNYAAVRAARNVRVTLDSFHPSELSAVFARALRETWRMLGLSHCPTRGSLIADGWPLDLAAAALSHSKKTLISCRGITKKDRLSSKSLTGREAVRAAGLAKPMDTLE